MENLTDITWNEPFRSVIKIFKNLVNLEVFALPGIACFFDTSFNRKWLFKISSIPCVTAIYLVATYVAARRAKHKVNRNFEASGDNVQFSEFGMKVARAYAAGQANARAGAYAFFTVYLLFPGVAATCFEMMNCRTVDGDAALLKVDYTHACFDPGGSPDSARMVWFIGGIIGVGVFPLGIPLFFARQLYINRKIIRNNPNCIKVAVYRPLFQFYKPAYMWIEIVFMLQKVVLVGFISLLKPGLFSISVSILVTMLTMGIICRTMPSKTEPYNKANIMSQIVIVLTYFGTLFARSPPTGSCSVQDDSNDIVAIALLVVYCVMMVCGGCLVSCLVMTL